MTRLASIYINLLALEEKLVREKEISREEVYRDSLAAMTLDGAVHEGGEELILQHSSLFAPIKSAASFPFPQFTRSSSPFLSSVASML